MFKISTVFLGALALLPVATGAAQASGGCGPFHHRGAFNQCWLNPPTFRPRIRLIPRYIGGGYFGHPAYIARAHHERHLTGYDPYFNHHQNYHYNYNNHHEFHRSYHYSYHFSHYNYHYAHFFHHDNRHVIDRRRFVNQHHNLINERHFLNHVAHPHSRRYL